MVFKGSVAEDVVAGALPPYRQAVALVARAVGSDPARGLTSSAVRARLRDFGRNVIARRRRNLLAIVGRRVTSALTLLLLAAVGVSLALGETADALLIGAVVLVDILVGLLYESVAQYRIEGILGKVPRLAEVVRAGALTLVPAEEVVPGDLVVLRRGGRVPADLRLTASVGLTIAEAVLTGEPGDTPKRATTLSAPAAIGDQRNMAFAGTTVTGGEGRGIVVATGERSVLGTIARRVAAAGAAPTPLEARLRRLGGLLGGGVVIAGVLLFALGFLRGEAPAAMFRTSLTLVVAAIPEGLTFLLTVALAVGAVRLLRRRAAVRHLTAAETLGDVTVVVTDKTGTLTTGELTLRRVSALAASGAPGRRAGETPFVRRALAGALVGTPAGSAEGTLRGSAIERALESAAAAAGLDVRTLRREFPLFATLSFDARRRYHASLHDDPRSPRPVLFVAGAPEVLLPRSVAASDGDKSITLTADSRARLLTEAAESAAAGARVLAVCERSLPLAQRTLTPDDIVHLTFLAQLHFDDPLRPDAARAVTALKAAGVRVLLLTGDHPGTAAAVATAVGLKTGGAPHLLNGIDLAGLSDAALAARLRTACGVARVDPFEKERVIAVLQRQGEIVAMLGDGVNDAIALRRADLGVAVATATDVAQDASDLVLLTPGLAVLGSAVAEGRRIRETVRTVLAFLFATNATEILAVGGSLLLGLPLPFLAAQLLWINVVTDGTSVVALALEPESTRQGDPVPGRQQGIFRREDLLGIFLSSLAVLLPTMIGYVATLVNTGDVGAARTLAFVTLSLSQTFVAFSFRSLTVPLHRLSPWGNPWLLLSVALSLLLLLAAVHWPPLARLLGAVPLDAAGWARALALALGATFLAEARKFFLPQARARRKSAVAVPSPGRAPARTPSFA